MTLMLMLGRKAFLRYSRLILSTSNQTMWVSSLSLPFNQPVLPSHGLLLPVGPLLP